MSSNRKRHRILRIVHNSLKETRDGVTPKEIKLKMNIDEISLISLIQELLEEKYLRGDSKKCHMTHKGVNAYTDKIFLNRMWYRKGSNWLAIIAIIISIIALFRPD